MTEPTSKGLDTREVAVTSIDRIHRLLNPTSIAVVGASERSVWSSVFIKNLQRWGFPGEIHLVNPRTPVVFSQPTTPTIQSIDGDVDHALICVPAALTMDVLRDCDRAGVGSVTAIASGFAEAGPEGQALAAEGARFCEEHGISLIGPNCYGFVNFDGPTALSRNWFEGMPPAGAISLVSQSGQVGLSMCGSAYGRGVDLRYLVSSGNELVVTSTDYFDYFVDDPQTRVLGGALERIANPEAFSAVATRALEAGKPIVVCKMGRSAIGQRVAEAHTASVAGDAVVVETFLRDHGVVVVDTVDELIETCGVLASGDLPTGGRTLFVGGSGGAGGYFADLADASAIDLVPLSEELRAGLAEATGLAASAVENPLDLTVAGVSAVGRIAEVVAASAELDVLVVQGEQPRSAEVHTPAYLERVGRNMTVLAKARAAGLWSCFASPGDREPTELGRTMTRDLDALYLHGSTGVAALAHAIDLGSTRADRLAAIRHRNEARRNRVPETVASVLAGLGTSPTEAQVKAMLASRGFPVLQEEAVTSADEAVAAAARIGHPVVLKISSPDIAHKSDVGGVVLNLADGHAVREAYAAMWADVSRAAPDARLDGALASPFLSGGVEMLLGVVVDPSLGPVVVVGAGGVYVELFGDSATALPPFDTDTAESMLRSLRVWKMLEGARGAAPADVPALCEAMVTFSELVHDLAGALVSLEINPLVVRPVGSGVVALDAVIELRSTGVDGQA